MRREERQPDEVRRALGPAPLPDPERQWRAIRAELDRAARERSSLEHPARRRQVSRPVAVAAGFAAVVLGMAGGTYRQFAAPTAWQVVGASAVLDTGWTDVASDTLRVEVGRIGRVSLEPGSRARVQRGGWNEHRLELARGAMHAVIAAPPRLFFVQTPSALATDLGCAYDLRVLPDGGTALHVTVGWVEISHGDRRSIVPAGLRAEVAPDGTPSVPFDPAMPGAAHAALDRLAGDGAAVGRDTRAGAHAGNGTDIRGGTRAGIQAAAPAESSGSAAQDLALLLAALDSLDRDRPANIRRQSSGITLWHLLQRVEVLHRAAIFDALATRAATPVGVTREGILALDRQMLDRWRRTLHPMWGEDSSPIVAVLQRAWLALMD
jgi:hypothetical protein